MTPRSRSTGIHARGRGALSNATGRFEHLTREHHAGDHDDLEEEAKPFVTSVTIEHPKTILTRNDSPDIAFSQSINPYQGCEHGCIYCYARPSHAYLNLSPGLDFETKLTAKINAAELLEKELARPGYRCEPICLGANTDPYQPIERQYAITRKLLEVLERCRHPVTLVTKSALVLRDRDLLTVMAQRNLVRVMISVTSLQASLARALEPRASAPFRRLEAMEELARAGVPVGVLVAPVIPVLNDSEIEDILGVCQKAGADSAGYVLLRLPLEIKELFKEWLATHYPLKAEHVMSLIRQSRGGKEYDSTFGKRMRGTGIFADMIAQRFATACRRLGLNRRSKPLDASGFKPSRLSGQLGLFD